MNRRILLLILLLALGGLAWWLYTDSAPTTLDRPLSDFAVQDTARVDRIFITDQFGKTIDLRRTDDGWRLNGVFGVDETQVNLLLRTFKRIEVRSPVPKSAEANVLRTMGAGGRKVEIYQGGEKPSKIWIVGHATKDHFGTYMLLEKPGEGRSNAPFVTNMPGFTGVLNTRFHTDLDEWRNSTLFHFPDLYQVASVELDQPQAPSTSYRIENSERGQVRLLNAAGRPLPMDTFLVKGALLPYQQINYDHIIRDMPQAKRDSLLRQEPNHILRLTERDGTEHEARFWYSPYKGPEPEFDAARPLHDTQYMYALVQDSLLVVVQRIGFDRILQPATAFRP